MVEVVLLYAEGCPNWKTADDRLRAALDRLGRPDMVVSRRRVLSNEQAEAEGFGGSPTILVDGRDLFPGPDATAGLSCRTYRNATGLAGAPTVDQLLEALA